MQPQRHESVWFTGHVQGVGFRYTTRQVAKEFEVTGFVGNLADGRVLVEVAGEGKEVEEFIAAVQDRMHGYIRRVERSPLPAAPTHQGFTIR